MAAAKPHASTPDSGEPEKGADPVERPMVDASAQSQPLSGPKLLLVMAGVAVVILLAMLDISIISTAIPQITSDFHRLEDVGWYVGAYQLASATVQPLTGKLLSYFSSKWTYLSFFLVFEVGSAICGAATSSTMLIVGRAVAGLGAAGLMNGSLTIVQGACTPESRPRFYINLPLGGLAAVLILLTDIPEQTPKKPATLAYVRALIPTFDLVGFVLFAPASIMLLLALQFGSGDYGWKSSQVIGLFCGAVVTGIIFVYWERRMGDDAMIPLPMVRQRVIWSSALNFALLMLAVIVGSNFLPIYLQSVKGLSPTMSGVYMLASILTQIIFIFLAGGLVTKLGYYIGWAIFSAVATAIGCGLIATWRPDTGLGKIIGYQILLGARGAGMHMGVVAIQATLPRKMAAVGNSFLVFCQNIFGAIFITVANSIFQESLRSDISSSVPGISPEAAIAAGGSSQAPKRGNS
ncbi:hypothetical protein PLIIFM63780_005443 [Purpureocillium lilacinum]|nr:hypothetical protein PLIIFM63780_005443 [Purpureocillium lilacinum]